MDDCNHAGGSSWWVNDAQGIPLARVCDQCEAHNDQSDVDEPIEPED